MNTVLQALAGDVVRLLLPNACVTCDRPGPPDTADSHALICGLCRARLAPLSGGCGRCAQPLPPIGPCRFCAEWEALDGCRSAVWLDARARRLVHALKYSGCRTLGTPMADVMARWIPAPRAGHLVPVPLGARRQQVRGYNQAAELARGLQRRWRLPVTHALLARARETRTQTTLAPAERLENVTGAFRARSPRNGGSCTIILVDDVMTTGATLLAAAVALRKAGWGPIRAVTFARAEPWGRRITG